MFGYVKAYKPYMRMYEYEIYRGIYCGICKRLSREYGFVTRLPLSYDIAFLALFELSYEQMQIKTCKKRCPLHPVNKTVCLCDDEGLEFSCAAAVILTYHKLRDDMSDKGFLKKAAALGLLPFYRSAHKKASKKYPELSEKIGLAMKEQAKIERRKTGDLDEAAHPTGLMMEAVFSELGKNDEQKELLGRFGYLIGRYVYICDALDDLEDDLKKGGYDPLIVRFCKNGYDRETRKRILGFCKDSINFTLGGLADVYVKMQPLMYKDIIDNIIYLGLKDSFTKISRKGKERNK